jgi:hypothetical protein
MKPRLGPYRMRGAPPGAEVGLIVAALLVFLAIVFARVVKP